MGLLATAVALHDLNFYFPLPVWLAIRRLPSLTQSSNLHMLSRAMVSNTCSILGISHVEACGSLLCKTTNEFAFLNSPSVHDDNSNILSTDYDACSIYILVLLSSERSSKIWIETEHTEFIQAHTFFNKSSVWAEEEVAYRDVVHVGDDGRLTP